MRFSTLAGVHSFPCVKSDDGSLELYWVLLAQIVSSQAHSDWYSPEYLSALCRSLEYSLCTTVCCLVLWPKTSSLHVLRTLSFVSSTETAGLAWIYPSCAMVSSTKLEQFRTPHFFPISLGSLYFVVRCPENLCFLFCPFFKNCFRQEGK